MTDQHEPVNEKKQPAQGTDATDEQELHGRREFLIGLGRWSHAVIAGAVVGGTLLTDKSAQASWANRRGGGGWVNAKGGGSAGWVNAKGGGGAGWVNAKGGGGAGWVNAKGGGGAAWANRRGGSGGSWANKR